MSLARIIVGDAREVLRTLPRESVHCVVTSPPYWGLRDYGVAGQLGLEETPDEYVASLVEVMREVREVLRRDGTLWLNVGDTYVGGRSGGIGNSSITSQRNQKAARAAWLARPDATHRTAPGLKPKDMVGIPWRLAFALQRDGWWLRSDIVWAKPSPMPESVRDRPTRSHEYLFLLARSESYYYNAGAIAEPITEPRYATRAAAARAFDRRRQTIPGGRQDATRLREDAPPPTHRNKRSVWTIASQPFDEAHFATFPPRLVEPCVLAGSPRGGLVLDPFAGAGTVGLVALQQGRSFVGVELKDEYAEMAVRRIGLFASLERRGYQSYSVK